MKKFSILFLLLTACSALAFGQKDTLVYYVMNSGTLAPDRQSADYRLIIFPVGSGSSPKLSAIKGYDKNGKLEFSGSSSVHKFPIDLEADFTEYYSNGEKKSVRRYEKGHRVGDETYYYMNGQLKLNIHPTGNYDAEIKEFYENGTIRHEAYPAGNHRYSETYYYPDGKVKLKTSKDELGVGELTEYYSNGKIRLMETLATKGEKDVKTTYFANGNLYFKEEIPHDDAPFTGRFIHYITCYDSTGKVLTLNGNGHWMEYNEDFTLVSKEGKVVNGYADSVWTVQFWPGSGEYETYKKGRLENFKTFGLENTNSLAGEKAPQFRGGRDSLNYFLGRRMRYPAPARQDRVTGRVVLAFMVEKDGTLSNLNILTGIGDGCDDEVIRVMKMSPLWIPGEKNGIPARLNYAIVVTFTLNDNATMGWIRLEGFGQ